MTFHTLAHLLEELENHPDELYVNERTNIACMWSTKHDAFIYLSCDCSGTQEEQDREIVRVLEDIEQGRVG